MHKISITIFILDIFPVFFWWELVGLLLFLSQPHLLINLLILFLFANVYMVNSYRLILWLHLPFSIHLLVQIYLQVLAFYLAGSEQLEVLVKTHVLHYLHHRHRNPRNSYRLIVDLNLLLAVNKFAEVSSSPCHNNSIIKDYYTFGRLPHSSISKRLFDEFA